MSSSENQALNPSQRAPRNRAIGLKHTHQHLLSEVTHYRQHSSALVRLVAEKDEEICALRVTINSQNDTIGHAYTNLANAIALGNERSRYFHQVVTAVTKNVEFFGGIATAATQDINTLMELLERERGEVRKLKEDVVRLEKVREKLEAELHKGDPAGDVVGDGADDGAGDAAGDNTGECGRFGSVGVGACGSEHIQERDKNGLWIAAASDGELGCTRMEAEEDVSLVSPPAALGAMERSSDGTRYGTYLGNEMVFFEGRGGGVGNTGTGARLAPTAVIEQSNSTAISTAHTDVNQTSSATGASSTDVNSTDASSANTHRSANLTDTVWPPTHPTPACTSNGNPGYITLADSNTSQVSTPSTGPLIGPPARLRPRLLNPHVVHLCLFRTFSVPWRAIIRCGCPKKQTNPRKLINFYYLVRTTRQPEWICGSSRGGLRSFARELKKLKDASPTLALNSVRFLWLMRYGLGVDWTWTIKCFRKTFPEDPACIAVTDNDLLMVRVVMRLARDLDRVEKIIEGMAKWLERDEEEVPAEVARWLKEFAEGMTIEMLRGKGVGRFVFDADSLARRPAPTLRPAPTPSLQASAIRIPDSLYDPSISRNRLFSATYTVEQLLRTNGVSNGEFQRMAFLQLRAVIVDIARLPNGAHFLAQSITNSEGGIGLQHSTFTSANIAAMALRRALLQIQNEPRSRQRTDEDPVTTGEEHAEPNNQEAEEEGGGLMDRHFGGTPPPPPPSSLDSWRESDEDEGEIH